MSGTHVAYGATRCPVWCYAMSGTDIAYADLVRLGARGTLGRPSKTATPPTLPCRVSARLLSAYALPTRSPVLTTRRSGTDLAYAATSRPTCGTDAVHMVLRLLLYQDPCSPTACEHARRSTLYRACCEKGAKNTPFVPRMLRKRHRK
eukprot:835797-Rhodomonas_salina.1